MNACWCEVGSPQLMNERGPARSSFPRHVYEPSRARPVVWGWGWGGGVAGAVPFHPLGEPPEPNGPEP